MTVNRILSVCQFVTKPDILHDKNHMTSAKIVVKLTKINFIKHICQK